MMDLGTVEVEVTEWKIEKFDNSSHPVKGWKRFLPIQGGQPYEVVVGGDNKPTVTTKPEPVPYLRWLVRDYWRRFKSATNDSG